MPHEKPADRDAQRERAMTPLFCEKVVLGGVVKSAARKELTPSARSPPWTRGELVGVGVGLGLAGRGVHLDDARVVRRHLHVAHRLGGHPVADEDGQEVCNVEADRDGAVRPRPEEGERGRLLDGVGVPVRVAVLGRDRGDDRAEDERPEDEGRLEEGRAEDLEDDAERDGPDADEDVLGRAEDEAHVAVLVALDRALLDRVVEGVLVHRAEVRHHVLAAEDAAAEVLDARADEAGSDHHDGDADDERREELLADAAREEGDGDLEEGRDEARPEEFAVADHGRAVGGIAGRARLVEGFHRHLARNGQEGEGCAHDGDHAGAEVVRGALHLGTEDLDQREHARADPRRRDQPRPVVAHLAVALPREAGVVGDEEAARGGDAGDHREGVLQAHEEGDQEGQLRILAHELWRLDATL